VRARPTRLLITAALLAVAVPAAPAASAQPDPSEPGGSEQRTGSGPTPPPLGENRTVPVDNGQPDRAYTRKTDRGCIGPTGEVNPTTIPWGQRVLRVGELSQFATGAGQTVAVIDTGVNRHDFLGGRLLGGGDYVQRGGNGLDDCDGHGTAVAGVIAADPKDRRTGFRGIAPQARILSIRQSSDYFEFRPQNEDEEDLSKAGSLTTLARAVVNAARQNVDVINMSVDTCRLASETGPSPIDPAERELQRALRFAFEDKNVVLVASAGNTPSGRCEEQNSADPENPTYIVSPPWFSEYVLSVAAIQRDGAVAKFSMHGPWVGVAGPGTEIISLDPANPAGLADQTLAPENGELVPIQGTSFSAPYVAGLAALIRERFEKLGTPLSAWQIVERIKRTASHPAGRGGRNNQIGFGMVNPVGALTAKIPGEEGITADAAVDAPFEVPPAPQRDWTPERVAVIGSAGGVCLLLLTLFIVHTVRRQRRDRTGSA
jgi:membrane-anchored mycosin MYCP